MDKLWYENDTFWETLGPFFFGDIISISRQIPPSIYPTISEILGNEPLLQKKDVLAVSEIRMNGESGHAPASTKGSLLDSVFARKAADIKMVVHIRLDGAAPEACDHIRGNAYSTFLQ